MIGWWLFWSNRLVLFGFDDIAGNADRTMVDADLKILIRALKDNNNSMTKLEIRLCMEMGCLGSISESRMNPKLRRILLKLVVDELATFGINWTDTWKILMAKCSILVT